MSLMSHPSIIEQRRDQAFPKLTPAEVARLCRFGEVRVAAAVGEGAQVVATLHTWLAAPEVEAAKAREVTHA
jgi:uncharacterized protein (DUF2384 family)